MDGKQREWHRWRPRQPERRSSSSSRGPLAALALRFRGACVLLLPFERHQTCRRAVRAFATAQEDRGAGRQGQGQRARGWRAWQGPSRPAESGGRRRASSPRWQQQRTWPGQG